MVRVKIVHGQRVWRVYLDIRANERQDVKADFSGFVRSWMDGSGRCLIIRPAAVGWRNREAARGAAQALKSAFALRTHAIDIQSAVERDRNAAHVSRSDGTCYACGVYECAACKGSRFVGMEAFRDHDDDEHGSARVTEIAVVSWQPDCPTLKKAAVA